MKNFLGHDGFIWWIGVVEDSNDPAKFGRCKVRCFGYYDNDDSNRIPTEDLPWAIVLASANGTRSFSPLKPGSWVFGFFADSLDAQQPIVVGYIPSLIDENVNKKEKGYDYGGPSGWQNYKFATDETSFETARKICQENENVSPVNIYVLDVPDGKSTLNKSHKLIIHGSNTVNTTSNTILGGGDSSIIRLEHSNGSYIAMYGGSNNSAEISANNANTKVTLSNTGILIEDGYTAKNKIILSNNTITIDHSNGAIIVIEGDGKITITTNNDLDVSAKNVNFNVEEEFSMTAETIVLTAAGNVDINGDNIYLN